jgi:VCBS repeat protein/PASTA domain-containing protein
VRFLGAVVGTAGLLVVPLASAALFGRAAHIPIAGAPLSVIVVDATQDGILDIVTANSASPGMTVLPGRADGSFERALEFARDAEARALVSDDFDDDGALDLALADATGVTIYGGDEAGLVPGESYAIDSPASLAATDLDNDGLVDLVVTSSTKPAISVLRGVGDGTFDAPVEHAIVSPATSVFAADLDDDEVPDLAAAGAGGLFALAGLGDGTFEPARKLAGPDGLRFVTGDDLDLDGTTDLVLAGSANQVFVGLNDGDATFSEFTAYTVGGTPAQVAIGDVDDDALADLITANRGSGDISVLSGEEGGGFHAQSRVKVGRTPTGLGVDDLNQDGSYDVVTSNLGSRSVTVLLQGVSAPQPVVCLVPRVVRRTLKAAKRMVRQANCSVGRVRRKFSRRVRRGRVIAQKPIAGLRLPRSTEVSLLVSRGRRR